ncbi:MAG: pseudouridine synthase [Clostridium sp.]
MLNILYEDEAVLVVWKPVGMESQSGHGFDADMVSEIRRYLSTGKPVDNPQAVHKICGTLCGSRVRRLDKPVSGVMVYAKTKNAAAARTGKLGQREGFVRNTLLYSREPNLWIMWKVCGLSVER